MKLSFNIFFKSKAQTATELAIFGAVLIFVLGSMIRYSLNANYAQTQSLKAMRLAMQQSFLTSEQGFGSRSTATILYIEDRTTADSSKFGSIARSPFMASSSAAFSKNLFISTKYPADCSKDPKNECCEADANPRKCDPYKNIPVMDMIINGQHFQFTTAGFKEYSLLEPAGCPLNTDGTPDTECERLRGLHNWAGDLDPACTLLSPCRLLYATSANLSANALWNASCSNQIPAWSGCNKLFRDGGPVEGSGGDFSWQWYRFRATSENISIEQAKNNFVDVDGDLKEEAILEMIDIDGYRYNAIKSRDIKRAVPIRSVRVIDYQAGDLDLTSTPSEHSRLPAPIGLQDESQFHQFVNDGTYLTIEEGLLAGGSQMVRSTQKKNLVVVIERLVQLTNDTGMFCGNCSPGPDCPSFDGVGRGVPNNKMNPDVQACVNGADDDCFSPANRLKTCFNESTKRLYVRSRIGDTRGRKWITDLGARGY